MTVLHPTKTGVAGVILTALAGVVFAIVRAFVEGRDPAVPLVVGLIGLAVLTGAALLYARNARVEIDAKGIRSRTILGDERVIVPHRINRVVVAKAVTRVIAPQTAHVAVLDANGEPLLRLTGARWDALAFAEAAQVFGDRLTVIEEPHTVRELTDRFPLALPFTVRRPVLVVLIGLGGVAAGAILVSTYLDTLG